MSKKVFRRSDYNPPVIITKREGFRILKTFEYFDKDYNWTKDEGEEPKLFYDSKEPKSETNDDFKYNWMLKDRLPWVDSEKKYFDKFINSYKSKIYDHGYQSVDQKTKSEVFWFSTDPINDNDNLIEIYLHKCDDKNYLSQVFQMSDGNKLGMDLRYYLDDFGTLIKFLNKWV